MRKYSVKFYSYSRFFKRRVFLCNKIKFVRTRQKHSSKLFICTIWSWNLYKFKNNYIQANYTHKVVKVESQNFFVNEFSEFCLMFMATSQPSYLCSLSLRYELNANQKRSRYAKASSSVK